MNSIGAHDLCYRDVVKAGTFAAHGIAEYIDDEECAGNFSNYLDFIYEALLTFMVGSADVMECIETSTGLKHDARSSILLSCINCYARLPLAHRRAFFNKNSLVSSVFDGETAFRWHSECNYLRYEADQQRRLRYLYKIVARFIREGGLLAPELPYRDLGGVTIPVSVPDVPFLALPDEWS